MTKSPGYKRRRLAAMLAKKGILVDPEDLWFQTGEDKKRDGARWGSYHARFRDNTAPDGTPYTLTFHLSCWDTMTRCIQNGIHGTFEKDRSMGWGHVEVHALG